MEAPDLTKRPPRSVRVRLGGFCILPRMLDKGRAEIAGANGEYHYNCPLDQHFLKFTGIDPLALRAQLAMGKGDGEILGWILEHSTQKHTAQEIRLWSDYHDGRGPGSVEQREWFQALQKEIGPLREDIETWADLLDLDDHVSFGGRS